MSINDDLFTECKMGNLEVVKSLIDQGADVNAENKSWGDTPLIVAIEQDHEAVARLLIQQGANINFKKEKSGWTPLMYACEHGLLEIVNLFIAKGTDIEVRNTIGETLIVIASKNGRKDVVELLVSKGVDLNKKDEEGKTQFSRVCSIYIGRDENLKKRLCEIVAYLISKGADINTIDNDGNSPLTGAIDNFNEELIKYLIEHGANAAITNKKGDTPLSMLGSRPALRYLVRTIESRGVDTSSIYGEGSVYDGWIVWMDVTYTSSPELDLALKEASDRKGEVITSGTIWAVYNNEQSARHIGELLKRAGVRNPAISKVRCYKYTTDPRINKDNSRIMENGWTIENL